MSILLIEPADITSADNISWLKYRIPTEYYSTRQISNRKKNI